ncbi:hypothetical protein Ndes2526B_g02833 [Nannochloris sp. 'desiccata']|nr:putative Sorting nexin 1 [Chlorella desiccata (nom. nud.)]
MEENGSHPLDHHVEEEVPLDAPPPYESLVFDKSEMKSPSDSVIFRDSPLPANEAPRPRTLATAPPVPPSAFEIAVIDPVKQGEGVGAYVSYKVVSTVDFDGYRADQHEVIRRFRDFTWLKNRLRSQYRGAILPALPEKNVVEKYKMGGDFIEQRRAALEIFLRRVAAHPLLYASPDLRLFLQSDETEFAIESSRMSAEAGDAAPAATSGAASAARKTLNGAARLFKSISQSAAGLTHVGGSGSSTSAHKNTYPREEEESVEYLKARAYFSELENHLALVHKQAERLVRHHGALAGALSEFSGAMAALGRHQEEEVGRQAGTPVVRSFAALSDRAAAVAEVSKRSSEELAASFEAPMKEFMRSVRAAKKSMSDRSDALAARQAARADVDAKRARLTRLRATPGLAEERVVEAERDLQTAMAKANDATQAYSDIVQRMDSDITRFQQERVEEMGHVLALFSQVEAKAAADAAKLWRTIGPSEESAAA